MEPGSAMPSRRTAMIDAVAIEIAVLDDHVAQIDADAQHDAPVVGEIRFAALMRSCSSTAQSTAFTALANSASTPSPITLTMRP